MSPTKPLQSPDSPSSIVSPKKYKKDPLLPCSELVPEKTTTKLYNPLRHCLYKRVVIWVVLSLLMIAFVLFRRQDVSFKVIPSSQTRLGTETSPIVVGSNGQLQQVSTDISMIEEAQRYVDASRKKLQTIEDAPQELSQDVYDGETTENSDSDDATDQSSKATHSSSSESLDGNDSKSNILSGSDGEANVETEDEIPEYDQSAEESDMKILLEGDNTQQFKEALENLKQMPWLRFPLLNAYFHGLKTLDSKANHEPEYPNPARHGQFRGRVKLNKQLPKPTPYNPYNESDIKTCYLDKESKIQTPSLYAYNGIPKHMPDPAIGSYNLFGIRDDVCFDRFGRYGPYGLGYRLAKGGTGVGMNTEDSGSDTVWESSGQIDYSSMDWGDAQERCLESNSGRFRQLDDKTNELEPPSDSKTSRQAIVVRLYTGFKWTYLAVLNFRALISEVSLKSGGEYTVHFLMHVRDDDAPIWSDDVTVQKILDENVPPEFHSMVTMWSEAQMKLFYPGKFTVPIQNPSGQGIHGVYRSAHLPLQVFSTQHPEYEHIWNWEMDMRYLGNYYELFDRLSKWADKQPRVGLWERSARYYIPALHGDWDNFTETVERQTAEANRQMIFGPLQFHGKRPLRYEQHGGSNLPESCAVDRPADGCGVGEPADLITLNPMFDADSSGWVFAYDTTGYPSNPPRRCAIITASRMSRRLLGAMHEETWRHHHGMFSEMFPPSVALHHGFKATYAPHPMHIDRAWEPLGSAIDEAFNGGQDHSTSGPGSPFDIKNEHNHRGVSWYYNSEFSGLLWRRWLGYAQFNGRSHGTEEASHGAMRGGLEEESLAGNTGRMCLRSMLLHPIKFEYPAER